ncbi:MAG TPA: DUF2147 domain-containing protein [Bacteroidales bacterium]|jgi:uncharacterized protein (DUF2147 family)|nr:DUF2147 domain-containing protein [Bacteroidales bacterium]MDD4236070.1 DUF2147 domain-containing protein [Bacteroidales bacterium]MDY0160365.1 DUF2147 domain-containing protein [Bacteroidales bacterium]HXK81684.1 DUF2147 domain-containing protein [Bacteroidales bacterium]
MKTLNLLILTILLLGLSGILKGQDVCGKWKTIDDNTGKEKSIVKIYENNGKIYGKILKVFNNDDPNPLCTECPGQLKDKPIVGMIIIIGFEKKKDKWEGDGSLLDPENGKLYNGKIWVEDGKLQVRGYLGPFYRTQTWLPAE